MFTSRESVRYCTIADKTQLVYKEAIGEVYRSTVVEWTKEMSEING